MITDAFLGFSHRVSTIYTPSGREMMTGDIDITYSQLTSFKHFEGTAMVRIHRVAGPACPVYGLGNVQMLA